MASVGKWPHVTYNRSVCAGRLEYKAFFNSTTVVQLKTAVCYPIIHNYTVYSTYVCSTVRYACTYASWSPNMRIYQWGFMTRSCKLPFNVCIVEPCVVISNGKHVGWTDKAILKSNSLMQTCVSAQYQGSCPNSVSCNSKELVLAVNPNLSLLIAYLRWELSDVLNTPPTGALTKP